MMNYARDLAFNVRIRGYSEDEIAEALHEVSSHQAATGSPADDEFGSAKSYAGQFPRKKRQSRGARITAAAAILAIAYVALMLLLLVFRVDIRGIVGPVSLLPALVLVLAGVVAGFLTDYLRPTPHPRTDGRAAAQEVRR